MNELLYLLITALSSFVALFVIAKILGKRQVAQLEFVDYIIGISIGSIAAEMATDVSDKPIYYYLIAMAFYVVLDYIINLLGNKTPSLKHFFKGKPLMVIYQGKIAYKNLKKSKLSVNDLISLAREQGYFDISDIEYAIFENSGKLSIMPKGEERPTVAKDLKIKIEQASLPYYLVADGRISYSSLRELGKNKEWLFKKLKIENKKQLKHIILALYDKDKDKVITNYKEE
ncbi:MAG: DUF421 domain-containing protein [Clostridia bacterium]|nr:DUF421 domain-containing protein [Clostridia bacterium]